jgi:hypothetical protein
MGGGGGGGGFFGNSSQDESRQFQMTRPAKRGEDAVLRQLLATTRGQTPSIGQLQMKANTDMANQQALALAASQRGASNPALAFRQAQMANQQAQLESAQQAAIMGQQERMQAQQMLLSGAAGQRGVALNSAVNNQSNATQTRGQNMSFLQGAVSGAGQGMVAGALASDENAKKDIEPKKYAMEEIEQFLKVLKPSSYEYKDAKHGTGEKMGVMAQDLEKSEIGKTMVDTAPDGTKVVDTNKAIGAMLAAMSDMSKRVKKLEK